MTTYIILNSLVTLCLLVFCFYLLYLAKVKKNNHNFQTTDEKPILQRKQLDWKVYVLIFFAIAITLFSFASPFIFTRPYVTKDFDFTGTGEIGDTIGGLMNPFFTLAGVIVTGLAFYIQYKANEQQRELFVIEQEETKKQLQTQIDNQNKQTRIQQFESQFYEMLRLHRENVTEMKIEGYNFEEGIELKRVEKDTEGRKIFVTMKTELECIIAMYKKDNKLDKIGIEKCYKIFFSGLDEYTRLNPGDSIFSGVLSELRKKHENLDKAIKKNQERKEFIPEAKLYFNYKPFSGHASRLGHYFRHLYLTVKSIVNSDIVTDYDEKMKYLRILRAQLSNHEQILLFYNWLGGFGTDWENQKNAFFTEYGMIHNLWYDSLIEDDFINANVKNLREKEVKLRKGNMFEVD